MPGGASETMEDEMFENRDSSKTDEQFQLFEELELNQPRNVMKSKDKDDQEIRATVHVDPGNVSDRTGDRLTGTTVKVGKATMTATFSRPLRVGDVYLVTFERADLDVAPTYGQCRRVRLLTEDTYEAVVGFFAAITL